MWPWTHFGLLSMLLLPCHVTLNPFSFTCTCFNNSVNFGLLQDINFFVWILWKINYLKRIIFRHLLFGMQTLWMYTQLTQFCVTLAHFNTLTTWWYFFRDINFFVRLSGKWITWKNTILWHLIFSIQIQTLGFMLYTTVTMPYDLDPILWFNDYLNWEV